VIFIGKAEKVSWFWTARTVGPALKKGRVENI
jgi:hypothetical protein